MNRNRSLWAAVLCLLPILAACTARPSLSISHSTPVPPTATPEQGAAPVLTATTTGAPAATIPPTQEKTQSPAPLPTPYTSLVVTIPAPSLAENLLGEPDEQPVQVYLPPSYSGPVRKAYPVVYFLPGFGADAHGHNEYFPMEELARLVQAGTIAEMILVIPNGTNVLQGSFYVNSPVTGNWEDFICQDVVGYVDGNFRTIAEREARGIAGHSMGGFAALTLAMHHPDLFSASYSLSSGLFDETGLADSMMFDNDKKPANLLKIIGELSVLPEKEAIRKMGKYTGAPGFSLAYGAAFAPDPKGGFPFFDYPYELKNGSLVQIPEVWERWEDGFGGWPEKIASHHAQLASLGGIALDYGVDDHLPWIPRGSEYVSRLLSEAGIHNEIYRFEGGHGNKIPERVKDMMLPFFTRTLVGPEGID